MDGKLPGETPSPNIFLIPDVSLAPLVFFWGCLVVGCGDEGWLIPVGGRMQDNINLAGRSSVSYTHLTLPTILLV